MAIYILSISVINNVSFSDVVDGSDTVDNGETLAGLVIIVVIGVAELLCRLDVGSVIDVVLSDFNLSWLLLASILLSLICFSVWISGRDVFVEVAGDVFRMSLL